jgi:transposase
MTRRYALRDDQWERIKDLLPGREGHVGVTARDNRLFVDAVLYRYRAGIPWRDLPERFGDFRVVHTRHSRWSKAGVWQRVFEHLTQDADNEYAIELTPPSCGLTSTVPGQKRGAASASHRTQPRRAEHQDPRHGGCAGQPHGLSSHTGPSPRSRRR